MPRLRHSCGLNHLHYVTTSIPQGGTAPAISAGLTVRLAPKPAWAGVIIWPTVPHGGMGKKISRNTSQAPAGRHNREGPSATLMSPATAGSRAAVRYAVPSRHAGPWAKLLRH